MKTIDRVLFRVKHWQFFLAALALAVFFLFLIGDMDPPLFFIFFVWIPLIGIRLKKCLPGYYSFHYRMFLASWGLMLQTHDRATVNNYFWDIILLLLFFPVGVWFLQPRLNLLYDQYYR